MLEPPLGENMQVSRTVYFACLPFQRFCIKNL